jgi:RHS repeat-associated protein
MLSIYKKTILFLLQVACIPLTTQAQNTPQLGQTSVSGSSTTVTMPPMLNTNATPNYIRVYSPKVPMTLEPFLYSAPEEVQVATDYKDGFNRTMMSVAHNVTTAGATLMNVVQPVDTRFTNDGLGLLPFSSAFSTYEPNMFTVQKNYYNAKYPNENYSAASKAELVSTASARGAKTFLPGRSQIGQHRGTTTYKITNGINEVRIWQLDGSGLPVANGYYAAGQLFGERTFDTTGSEVVVYTDKDGNVIWKRIIQSTTVSGMTVTPNYAYTLYVYDEYTRLRYIFPPLAYAASIGGSIASTDLNQLCFQYRYDSRGRLSAERKPGEDDFTLFVYDKKDRLVMRQTPNEMAANQWEVSYYDVKGRPKATSLYSNSSNQSYWQSLIDIGTAGSTSADLSWHLMTAAGEMAYPGETAVSGNTMMSYTYYDDYGLADVSGNKWNTFGSELMFTEALTTDNAEELVRSNRTLGMITGTKIRILPAPGISTAQTGQWSESAVFYDDRGRGIYTVSWDIDGSNFVHEHYTGIQYDFLGRVLITKHKINNPASGPTESHTELSRNFYHPKSGQLTKIWHKNDDQIWTVNGLYSYDDLGKLKRKVLGNYGEVQDMSYNIRGQLTGINEIYALTGNKQGESRTFGEALRYDYGFDHVRYDGKAAGMIWRGSSVSDMYAYGYSYDYGGRLKSADFRYYTGSSWTTTNMDFTVSNLGYDVNGNITSMNQKGPGSSTPTFIDKLSYAYAGNRLTKVIDTITTDYGNGDFQNPNSSSTDYDYDANGNLSVDHNKGIDSVKYTYFNKPQVVYLAGGKSISYSYNAGGVKVQEKVVDPSATNKTTNYVGNYVYDGSQLSYVLTADGRCVYNKDSGTFKDEFFVKDHLGNVRSVVDVHTYPVMQYLASYELASANLENMFFDNIDQVRDDRPGANFDGGVKAARLNGGESDRQTGTSLLLKVMAGDKVEMNVNNFYENYDSNEDSPLVWEDMMNSVISTLTNGEGGMVEGEFHDVSKIEDNFSYANMGAFESLVSGATDSSKPKAYLNYILFDESMRIVESSSGAFQANGNGTWTQIGTTIPLVIPQNGYLAVYLNNRTQMACNDCANVFFDQLVVRFSKGALKEESHYYPFGLPIKNMGSAASGFTPNRRKYQGNEYITEAGLNWMDFQNRLYDPQIARFLQVDPMASETHVMSPYVAMNDEPVLNADPLGLKVGDNKETPSQTAYIRSVGGYYQALWQAMIDQMLGDNYANILAGWVAQDNAERSAQRAANLAFWNLVFIAVDKIQGRVDIYKNGSGGWAANYFAPPINIDNSTGMQGVPWSNVKGAPGVKVTTTAIYHVQLSNGINPNNEWFYNGLSLAMKYDGDTKGFSDFVWMQSVSETNNGVKEKSHRDGLSTCYPFYWSQEQTEDRSNGQLTKVYFEDAPKRDEKTWNYSFEAELSLMGVKDGKYTRIATFSWGYICPFPNVIVTIPLAPSIPSAEHNALLSTVPWGEKP